MIHPAGRSLCAVMLGIALIVGCGLDAPPATPTKVYRVGYLTGVAPGSAAVDFLRQALRERGYTEGQDLVLEARFAEGHPERLPGLAAELVALKLDLIVVLGINVALDLKQATGTIPIVVFATSDPVEAGLVASLARPGGNITGAVSAIGPEVVGRRLQLLKEAVPTLSRVAYLFDADPNHVRTYADAEFFKAGGLMALAPNYPALVRRAAGLVDKILKGALPADLPVEQATDFESVVNLAMAQRIGLTIPDSVMRQATEFIR